LWRCSGQAEPSVGILEKLLGNQEYRQWAAEYLRKMGPVAKSAAPALRKALRDEDRWLAREAALALWAMNMQREEAMKSLLETLKDEEMTNQITEDLAGLGPEAKACLPTLVANLKHYDVFLRMETAIALRRIDNRFADAVPILTHALSNKTRQSAERAAEYLGDLGPKARSALPALIQTALRDDDFDVYQATVRAIDKIDPGAAAKAGLGKKNIARNPLSRQDVASLWSDLTGIDPVQAYRAFWHLTETPAQTVSLFEDFLKPVPPVNPEHLAKLVEDLKSDQFRIRQAADKELSRWGELAEDTLRKSLKKKGPLEFSRRVQRLLDDLSPGSPRRPRLLRTIQVLEYHDTPEARRLLEKLTQGVPEAWQTEEARLALERMKKSMKQ